LDEGFPGVKHCKTVDELLFEVISGKLNEFEDLIDENTIPGLRELFENRKEYLERRKIEMSSLPRLIEIWKQFFTAISLATTAFEKTLQDLADKEHYFNSEVFKRSMIIELIRHLSNIWSQSSALHSSSFPEQECPGSTDPCSEESSTSEVVLNQNSQTTFQWQTQVSRCVGQFFQRSDSSDSSFCHGISSASDRRKCRYSRFPTKRGNREYFSGNGVHSYKLCKRNSNGSIE
jgi:hypothetical protein